MMKSSELLRNRITLVAAGLIAATLLSWTIGHGLGFGDGRHAGVAIIVVAFVKVRYVIVDFMELRHAPLLLRGAAELWTLFVCAILIVLFLH